MATAVLTRKTCDRCEKLLGEEPGTGDATAAAKKSSLLILETGKMGAAPGIALKYDDLCPPCEKRVTDLVAMIAKKGKDDDTKKDTAG